MGNANLLWRKGSFEILHEDLASAPSEEQNEIIKLCGTTSHQSQKTSRKTPAEFIKMLWEIGHLSVLEHSSFRILITEKHKDKRNLIELNLLRGNRLFCLTQRNTKPSGLIVSGNIRMFIEAYLRNPTPITASILRLIKQKNPVLFPSWLIIDPQLETRSKLILNPSLQSREEILAHQVMTVIFSHVSRGFSHEDVRSRNGHNKIASYTQRSTRYVNPLKKNSFNFILPYRKNLPTKIAIIPETSFSNKEIIDLFLRIYQGLINSHLRPEEARQWLPIGIETEIAQTMNFAEWYHWLIIRTQKPAHPEIRFVACNLLKQIQKDIPEIFKGFKFYQDEEGICYTKFTPPNNKDKFLI